MHNTAYEDGMPEIEEIVKGMTDDGNCSLCEVDKRDPSGDLCVVLGDTPAAMWPDAIACGDYPCFVVSETFVKAMREWGIRLVLGGTVDFLPPNDTGLSLDDAPRYVWIDGVRHRAATVDFEASGFVDVQFCRECGVRSDNIALTHQRQHTDPPPPLVINDDRNVNFDLFTTDISPTAFFATERVFQCARQYRLTNLAFRPVDKGVYADPVKY